MGLDATGILQTQGLALKIIGGIPILKNVSGSTLEKLLLPKHLDVGNIPNILSAVQSGGIGTLLQSPLGGALGSLTSAISTAQTSLSSLSGASGLSGLTTALGNLSNSAGSLSALADNLVGVTNTAGLATQLDLVGHMALAQSFGSSLPSSLGLDVVTAPIMSSSLLTGLVPQVQTIISQVVGSSGAPDGGASAIYIGTSAIAALGARVDAVATASNNALTTLAAAAPALCAASSAIALLVNAPAAIQAAMKVAIRPDMMATVQGIVDAHVAAIEAA